MTGKLHFCGTSTCNYLISLKASPYDHDCIVKGSLSLFDKLLGTTSQNYCGRLGVGAILEKVISFSSDLLLFEPFAGTQDIGGNVIYSSLESGSSCLANSVNIFIGNSTCTENASVSEPLSG